MSKEKSKKKKYTKFLFEFLSIFIAVISAFALNNWNDIRKDNIAESKILLELLSGLEKDKADVDINFHGHKSGIAACKYWRKIINGEETDLDSIVRYYFGLTRDFTSIQNSSGYETLKARGFELIKNDSLRSKIISLHSFDYQNLRKLEEEYYENQFQENYFDKLNNVIAPNLEFDSRGNIVALNFPISTDKNEKKLFLSYLWKIQTNRKFIMNFYDETARKITEVQDEIKTELGIKEEE